MLPRRRPRLTNLSDALSQDACPVCSVLKDFKTRYLDELDRHEVNALCGLHLWMVAKTVEARQAATLFLRLLSGPLAEEAPVRACDLCVRIAREEQMRVKEFVANVSKPEWAAWLRDRGALCRPHSLKVLSEAPKPAREAILRAMKRRRSELAQELTDLLRQADRNLPMQPGVLGRAAEFLNAQRGLHPYTDRAI